jgi:hypothetical protein
MRQMPQGSDGMTQPFVSLYCSFLAGCRLVLFFWYLARTECFIFALVHTCRDFERALLQVRIPFLFFHIARQCHSWPAVAHLHSNTRMIFCI